MRVGVMLLVIAAVGCSRRDAPPAPATVGSAEVMPVIPSAAPAAAAMPALTALGVCNRLRTTGHVSDCVPNDAGIQATFKIDKDGTGLVQVARSRAEFDRIMNGINAKGMQLATSEEKLVLVFWTSTGSEGSDMLIRMTVTTL